MFQCLSSKNVTDKEVYERLKEYRSSGIPLGMEFRTDHYWFYFLTFPCGEKTMEEMAEAVKELKLLELTEVEIVQIINQRPTTIAETMPLFEDPDVREDSFYEKIMAIVAKIRIFYKNPPLLIASSKCSAVSWPGNRVHSGLKTE
ncbi:RNA polymerase III subunit C17 family protein [Trichinella spiralis]|uniref:RNA polymerase III subunit C17 family protein n=1 Tax=Trichinella spiralis TaxID=6334 RepID=UPI0001EFD6E0|nr:RNA polymerase III subunit C17 family protein [Trichinella spiralis]